MNGRILEIRAPAIFLTADVDGPEYSVEIDEWLLAEHRFLGPRENPPIAGNYRVTLQRDLTRVDAGHAFIHGQAFAHALDRAWLYGTGMMLSSYGYEYLLTPASLPYEWTSNAQNVLPEDDWRLLSSGAYAGPAMRRVPRLPLRDCVDVLWALAEANDIVVQLVTYHVGAVTARDADLTMLLLSQGLEMGRSLLAGSNRAERESKLPAGVRERLRRPLDWFFEVSNQRRPTRHAIDNRAGLRIKPDFAIDEAEDFQRGANVLLHYLVTRAVGLPLVLAENGRTLRVDAA